MVQKWEDVPMVDPPEPVRLWLPKSAVRGGDPARYVGYSGRHRCEDCMELYTEHHRDGAPVPPLARTARFERKQGAASRLLCAEHKQLRQELEARR